MVELFYEEISRAKRSEKSQFSVNIEDLNAKLGLKKEDEDIPNNGNFGLGERNDRGKTLINYYI